MLSQHDHVKGFRKCQALYAPHHQLTGQNLLSVFTSFNWNLEIIIDHDKSPKITMLTLLRVPMLWGGDTLSGVATCSRLADLKKEAYYGFSFVAY